MNSTLLKIGIAYCAGLLTYGVIRNEMQTDQIRQLALEVDSLPKSDTLTDAASCACDNSERFNVDPKEDSYNYPIDDITACEKMIPHSGETVRGAWFSKITLNLMFCHKPDANGIFVYEGKNDAGETVYVAEAARNSKIISRDDGSSYIYYSRCLCPTICGVCGD